jgi:hypothetical protein
MAAEVNTGKFGDTASRNPAETGATTPVLFLSVCHYMVAEELTASTKLPMFRKQSPGWKCRMSLASYHLSTQRNTSGKEEGLT